MRDRPRGGGGRIGDALEPRVEQHELAAGQVRRGRSRARGRARRGGTSPGCARPAAPATRTAPGRRPRAGPAIRWSSVVLPAPFGPSRPVTPGAERERDVVDRDDVAVPARDVVELDGGDAAGAGAAGRRDGADGVGPVRSCRDPQVAPDGQADEPTMPMTRRREVGRSPAGRATRRPGCRRTAPKIAALTSRRGCRAGLSRTT